MNIAIFAWEALEGLSVGGGAVYASRLASAMAGAGHRVRLFTRLGDGQAMDEVVGGVNIRRCPWDRRRNFVDEIEALSDSFAHYYADAVRADGPFDIVHCHEWFTIGAGLRAIPIEPAHLAVSFHSTEWARTGRWPDSGDSARIAELEREGIDRADTVIAASFWIRRKINEQFHPPDWKCEVVYHGADTSASDAGAAERVRDLCGIPRGAPSILFAGRFSPAGGGDLAARACRLASAHFPEAKFLFVGAGPLEEEMRRELGGAGVFLKPQGRVVPFEYYQAVDLVLAPFRRDHNGRAVLPAWAAAKPVVILRDTVPAEFVMHEANGWAVPEDPVEMAAVLMNAFANRENTAWMGRNGRVSVETAFTWEAAAKRTLSAYGRREKLTPRTKTP